MWVGIITPRDAETEAERNYQGHVASNEQGLNSKASAFNHYSVPSSGKTVVISIALLCLQRASAALISFDLLITRTNDTVIYILQMRLIEVESVWPKVTYLGSDGTKTLSHIFKSLVPFSFHHTYIAFLRLLESFIVGMNENLIWFFIS